MTQQPSIVYTLTDEAPALATQAFLPVVEAFLAAAEIAVESRDISLAARILAAFPEHLAPEQRVADALAELGELTHSPEATIIKLPNISASLPQLKGAIAELQAQGFALPDYPDTPEDDAARAIRQRYDKVKGSAVNPVLREGNSDRRAPKAVKAFARRNPPRMQAWSPEIGTHVATMRGGDFRATEQSVVVDAPCVVAIEWVDDQGAVTTLKSAVPLQAGEIIDAAVMERAALRAFLAQEMAAAREQGLLFSLHLKATMMKISDPIIFGHAVELYFASLFAGHGELLASLGVDPRAGLAELLGKVAELPQAQRAAVEAVIADAFAQGPALAMVDSDRGITNLHVPSDVIIDASMPVLVRDGGKMWNAAGALQATKAVIPDATYAPIYREVVDFCKAHGAFDPATMGSVPNVGLMAQKAEEYGSHDKTFEIAGPGRVRVVGGDGAVLLEHAVAEGDIWRMCQTKAVAVRDWVRLAVQRARADGIPAVFWLDAARPHDAQVMAQVQTYLAELETADVEITLLPPAEAMRFTLTRLKAGLDTLSVTGNVLRDYLTDLFPILEVGTSARMLSIVPLLAGGGLFETGAGGSAPKHVQQLVVENHLRWDSLGEYLALAAALASVAERFSWPQAQVLADSLDAATAQYLLNAKAPGRRVGALDNRGSLYFLTRYWAEALAAQSASAALAVRFAPVAEALGQAEAQITAELGAVQGRAVSLGGYYRPDAAAVAAIMRPSPTFNAIIDQV